MPTRPLPFRPWSITGIGSLPHGSPAEAVAFMRRTSDIPYLPQLASAGMGENMHYQARFVGADGSMPHQCADAIGRGHAVLKVQVAGPGTVGAMMLKREVPYLAILEWFRNRFEVQQPIFQIDEPVFPQDPTAERRLADALEALRAAGAITMLHSCASDLAWGFWHMPADVLSFDSTIIKPDKHRAEALAAFVKRGGWVAWGAVPTDGRHGIEQQPARLADHLREWLAALGPEEPLARAQSLITPACGLGLRSEVVAERVSAFCREVAQSLESA